MKIYLDACCLNRPFDDQVQVRIRLEAEAVLFILGSFETGSWEWIGSEVLQCERFAYKNRKPTEMAG